MTFRVAPMAEEHLEGFRAVLDSVARERRYLTFLQAPPPESASEFVRHNIRKRHPVCVALAGDKVIGWCDVLPIDRPTRAHNGVLGIGVLAEFRGRGIGTALLREALQGARAFVREGVQRNAVRLDGAYEDLICMALLLDRA